MLSVSARREIAICEKRRYSWQYRRGMAAWPRIYASQLPVRCSLSTCFGVLLSRLTALNAELIDVSKYPNEVRLSRDKRPDVSGGYSQIACDTVFWSR
jgi:hypothetical protein